MINKLNNLMPLMYELNRDNFIGSKQYHQLDGICHSIQELKCLQKEIDDAEEERNSSVFEIYLTKDAELYNTIESSRKRIKEIIEKL